MNEMLKSYSMYDEPLLSTRVLYSRKLLREKTFGNFEVLWLFTKVVSAKFGRVVSFDGMSEQSMKAFTATIIFFPDSQVFSLESFSLYGS